MVYANPDKIIDKAYGTWLRAPLRIVKNNTRVRWLRNAHDGNNVWEKNFKQEVLSSTDHGCGGEHFMEVDGVIREVGNEFWCNSH